MYVLHLNRKSEKDIQGCVSNAKEGNHFMSITNAAKSNIKLPSKSS